jgi:adenylate cyclase
MWKSARLRSADSRPPATSIGGPFISDEDASSVAMWLTRSGLAGSCETDLLNGFCERAISIGLPVARATLIIDTLHPVYEGRAFRWHRDDSDEAPILEYGRNDVGEHAERWRQSPFSHMLETGIDFFRRNLAQGDRADFPMVGRLCDEGFTDCIFLIHRFAAEGVIGEMDCVYSIWITDAPGGFADHQVAVLSKLMPTLALAVKSVSLTRIAATLVETYLGKDPGRRVLRGHIARGIADRIYAVLWFSDLRSYTAITDAAKPEQIIPLLNDYAGAAISAIHDAGGDVLKLMGDGILAIFTAGTHEEACSAALAAETAVRGKLERINAARSASGLPATQLYLGLHVGDVLYGNIGSPERLDFTVVGPAVNEVSRIAAMCRSVDRNILVSSAFRAAASPSEQDRFVSVGRFALRGVGHSQELFTLDPGARQQAMTGSCLGATPPDASPHASAGAPRARQASASRHRTPA